MYKKKEGSGLRACGPEFLLELGKDLTPSPTLNPEAVRVVPHPPGSLQINGM